MKGISFPFRLNSKGLIAQTSGYDDLVRAHVIDALMTNQGERAFRPRYGCDVQSALFDPADELVRRDAAAVIRTRLESFAPRAIVREIRVDTGQKLGTVIISILYRPSLFATDTTLRVPVSSEFLARQSSFAKTQGEIDFVPEEVSA